MLRAVAGGGGSGTLTITKSTTTLSGFTDTDVWFTDGTAIGQDAGLTFTKTGGVLRATSLALGGATHVNTLDVTGAGVFSGTLLAFGITSTGTTDTFGNNTVQVNGALNGLVLYNTGALFWGSAGLSTPDLQLTRAAAATLRLGAAPVSSGAVAQTLTAQGNTGPSATSPNLTISAPAAPGATSVGGDLILSGGAGTSTNGSVRFGTVNANISVVAAGTIAIKDAGGTLRYLMYTNTP